MSQIILEPESRKSIRFQDCDPFGHLNNARYLDYFINAREDHLVQSYGFNLYEKAKETKCNWVVTRHQIAFLAPALLNETVVMRTSLRRYTDQAVLMEGKMFDAAGIRLKALLWTEFTYVSLATGRSTRHGPEIQAFLKDILFEEAGFPMDFAAREGAFVVKSLRP
jgi:acyl-CoA thioester hydrolase